MHSMLHIVALQPTRSRWCEARLCAPSGPAGWQAAAPRAPSSCLRRGWLRGCGPCRHFYSNTASGSKASGAPLSTCAAAVGPQPDVCPHSCEGWRVTARPMRRRQLAAGRTAVSHVCSSMCSRRKRPSMEDREVGGICTGLGKERCCFRYNRLVTRRATRPRRPANLQMNEVRQRT